MPPIRSRTRLSTSGRVFSSTHLARTPRSRFPGVQATAPPARDLGAGEPLADPWRAWFEDRFETDFSAVRLHRGEVAAELAQQFHARAFTYGSHIVLGCGAPAPDTTPGRLLLAHELTHTLQQSSPYARGALPPQARPRGPPSRGVVVAQRTNTLAVQCIGFPDVSLPSFSDVTGAVVNVGEGAWDAAASAGGAAYNFAADSLASVVEYFAPGILSFVRGGFAGQLTDLFCSGLDALVRALISPLEDLDIVSTIQETFTSLSEGVRGMWSGLGEGASAAVGALMKPLVDAIQIYGDPILQGMSDAADTADGIFSSLWDNVGVPVLDFLESVGGAVWSGFTGIVDWIGEVTAPLRSAAEEAWEWLCEQFNLAWESTSGIRDWLAEKASDLWDAFLETIEPIKEPLMAVAGPLLLLSPLGPIVILTQVIPPLYEKIVWLWNNWNTDEILVQARDILANDILPGVIGLVSGVSTAIANAAAWLAGVTADIAGTFGDLLGAFGANHCLTAVTRVLNHVSNQFKELADWADEGFTGLGDAIRAVFDALAAIFEPILDFLVRLIMVALNPPMLPIALTAAIWLLCPDDLKPPVINFVLGFIIEFVRGFPGFLTGLGVLASLMKAAAIGFLEQLRGQDDPVKVAGSNKVANIAAGGGPQFVAGYAVGLLEGIIDGILDPIRLIVMLVRVIAAVCKAIGDRLAPLIMEGVPPVGAAVGAFTEAMAVPPARPAGAGPSGASGTAASGGEAGVEPPTVEMPSAAVPSGEGVTESVQAFRRSGAERAIRAPRPDPTPAEAPPPVEERFGGPPGLAATPASISPERGAEGGSAHTRMPPAPPGGSTAELRRGPRSADTAPSETIPVPDPTAGAPAAEPAGAGASISEEVAAPAIEGASALAEGEGEFEVLPGDAIADDVLAGAISPGTISAIAGSGSELTGTDAELESGGEAEAREAGSSVDGLAGLLSSVWAQLIDGARGIGRSAADAFLRFLTLSDYQIGNKIGYVAGMVLLEVLLTILTGGAWLEASAAAKFLRPLVRILDFGGEILGAVARGFRAVRGPLMRGLGAARGFLGRFRIVGRILDQLESAAHFLFRFGDEAAGATTHGGSRTAGRADDVTRHADDVTRHADDTTRHADEALKAAQMPAAVAAARGICEANDRIVPSPPTSVVHAQLNALRPRFRWIQGFYSILKAPGVYEIHMLASDTIIDRRYTAGATADTEGVTAHEPRPEPVVEHRPGGSGVRPEASASPTPRTRPTTPEPPERFPDIEEELADVAPARPPRTADELADVGETSVSRLDSHGLAREAGVPDEILGDATVVTRGDLPELIADRPGGLGRAAPETLPTTRPVSRSVPQNLDVQEDIDLLRRAGADPGSIRVNQGQVDLEELRVGTNRPDLQATLNGRRIHIEYDRAPGTRALEHARRILSNDPDAIVILKIIDFDRIRRWANGTMPAPVPASVHRALTSPGEPLDRSTRAAFEPQLGVSLGGVRVHTDSTAALAARAINARAYTAGSHVVFGPAEYAPETPGGRTLLAHELAHVAQQSRAPAATTTIRAERVAEREAETFAADTRAQVAPPNHPGEQDAGRVARIGAAPSFRANRATVFRQVTPRPVARRTDVQILGDPAAAAPTPGMTLSEFRAYTREQADWFVEPTLTAGTVRNELWDLLLRAESGPHILSGIGDILLSDLRAVPAADWPALQAFCRGTHSSGNTVRIFPPLPVLADRIALGRTLLGIEAVIPPAVLEVTVSQVQLIDVQTGALVPKLTDYWSNFEPHIEQTFTPTAGARGPEFERVITFLISLGAGGLTPLLPLKGASPDERWVRNLHRFPLPMLLRLVANLAVTTGLKRLILVLHTGHDAPGAFQESASLFSNLVLLSPNNLVLMIEGATSLSAITDRIPHITTTWGKLVGGVRRISQVLIAGHGSAQSVGMAGTGAPTASPDAVSYPPEESLNIGGTPAERATTQALLDALMNHMDPAAARILFAGCLVGSTHAPAGTAAAAIPGALATHQSLGAFTEARAAAAGLPAGRVQAARASVALASATSLFTPAGNLAVTYPFDPNAFGGASIYASTGVEPEGVLRAAVEVGAINTVTAETLLHTRLGMAASGGWYDTVTRLLVGLALPPMAVPPSGVDLERVNELANIAHIPFLVFWPQFGVDVSHFTADLNPQPFAADVYTGIAATAFYTTPTAHDTHRMRIIIDQGWLDLAGAAQVPTFLAGILATGLSADGFESFLDLGVLTPHAAALLPLAGAPGVEQLRLALAWFFQDDTNAHVRSFLTAHVTLTPGAPAAFTAAVSTEIIAAGRTGREILDQLGFAATASAAAVGGAPPLPLANLALPGSAINTLLARGRSYEATVIAHPTTIVRRGPDAASPGIMALSNGATVRVTGTVSGWAAVDVWGALGFIDVADLWPPPPP